MKIRLENDFHSAFFYVIPKGRILSARQVARAKKALCGISGCTCGDALGQRGNRKVAYIELPLGGVELEEVDND